MSDFFSKTGPDTCRSILMYGKEQESLKNYFITRQKKIIFLGRFHRRNVFFRNVIRKDCFQMILNAKQSPEDSL